MAGPRLELYTQNRRSAPDGPPLFETSSALPVPFMKAVQVVSRGKAQFVDVAPPSLLPAHALIRTERLSLCGSDIRMLHHAPEHAYPFPPGTTGHEMVGVVEQVGDPSTGLRVGDAVLALAPNHQAMAEYFLAKLEHIIPLPPEMPSELLLQAQQFGTVLYASQRLESVAGKSVVVIGQGSAGLFFNTQLCRMGAAKVIAMDLESHRLDRAATFGATHAIHNQGVDPANALREINGGRLADVVVEAAGDVAAINLAIDLVDQCGEILYFGYPRGQVIPFNFEDLFHKCCRVNTIVGASVEQNQASTRTALQLIASGEVDVAPLITHRLPFRDVIDAYELHRTRGDRCLKIVIEMPS